MPVWWPTPNTAVLYVFNRIFTNPTVKEHTWKVVQMYHFAQILLLNLPRYFWMKTLGIYLAKHFRTKPFTLASFQMGVCHSWRICGRWNGQLLSIMMEHLTKIKSTWCYKKQNVWFTSLLRSQIIKVWLWMCRGWLWAVRPRFSLCWVSRQPKWHPVHHREPFCQCCWKL